VKRPAMFLGTVALVGLAIGCGSPVAVAKKPAVVAVVARRLSVDDLLAHPADVKVTLHPPAVAQDRVYGALLRRASALAAGYAGPPTLGTTALLVLERTDEVDAAVNDAGEAVVILRGVPGDLDVSQVVDESGHAIWRPLVGDVRHSFVEYEPASDADVTLFVIPGRVWVIAAGAARMRTREVLVQGAGVVSFAEGDAGLAVLVIRGSSLVSRDVRLRTGGLAPLGHLLSRASFELTAGAQGVLVARLEYPDDIAASGAEQTAHDVVSAFRRMLEEGTKGGGAKARAEPPPLSWLAAAGVDRAGSVVTVRAPIPRRWLDAIAQADLEPGARANAGASAGATKDLPWDLWRRSAPVPSLSLPDAQEPSQAGGSL
jgi:hypothetical protein